MSIIQEALKKARSYAATDTAAPKKEAEKKTEKQAPTFLYDKPVADVIRDTNFAKDARPASSRMRLKEAGRLLIVLLFVSVTVAVSGFVINKAASRKSRDFWKSPAETVTDKAPEGALTEKKDISGKSISGKDEGRPFKGVVESITDSLIKQSYSNFILNGVMYLEGEPRAIINNTVVREGDSVGGATVIRIDKDRVILKANEAEIVLQVS